MIGASENTQCVVTNERPNLTLRATSGGPDLRLPSSEPYLREGGIYVDLCRMGSLAPAVRPPAAV